MRQVRDLVATDCALMLERLPGLHLAFSDGTPFADDATLEWIARYAKCARSSAANPRCPCRWQSAHTDWDGHRNTGNSDLAVEQKDSMPHFSGCNACPRRRASATASCRQLVMARVAERVDRLDTALHLLTTLDATAQRFDLAVWEPSLAFEAKHHLMRLLKIRMTARTRISPRSHNASRRCWAS
jgi:type VI secretion system protein VasJ